MYLEVYMATSSESSRDLPLRDAAAVAEYFKDKGAAAALGKAKSFKGRLVVVEKGTKNEHVEYRSGLGIGKRIPAFFGRGDASLNAVARCLAGKGTEGRIRVEMEPETRAQFAALLSSYDRRHTFTKIDEEVKREFLPGVVTEGGYNLEDVQKAILPKSSMRRPYDSVFKELIQVQIAGKSNVEFPTSHSDEDIREKGEFSLSDFSDDDFSIATKPHGHVEEESSIEEDRDVTQKPSTVDKDEVIWEKVSQPVDGHPSLLQQAGRFCTDTQALNAFLAFIPERHRSEAAEILFKESAAKGNFAVTQNLLESFSQVLLDSEPADLKNLVSLLSTPIKDGQNILQIACKSGNPELVNILSKILNILSEKIAAKDLEPIFTAQDSHGKSAIDYAKASKNPQILEPVNDLLASLRKSMLIEVGNGPFQTIPEGAPLPVINSEAISHFVGLFSKIPPSAQHDVINIVFRESEPPEGAIALLQNLQRIQGLDTNVLQVLKEVAVEIGPHLLEGDSTEFQKLPVESRRIVIQNAINRHEDLQILKNILKVAFEGITDRAVLNDIIQSALMQYPQTMNQLLASDDIQKLRILEHAFPPGMDAKTKNAYAAQIRRLQTIEKDIRKVNSQYQDAAKDSARRKELLPQLNALLRSMNEELHRPVMDGPSLLQLSVTHAEPWLLGVLVQMMPKGSLRRELVEESLASCREYGNYLAAGPLLEESREGDVEFNPSSYRAALQLLQQMNLSEANRKIQQTRLTQLYLAETDDERWEFLNDSKGLISLIDLACSPEIPVTFLQHLLSQFPSDEREKVQREAFLTSIENQNVNALQFLIKEVGGQKVAEWIAKGDGEFPTLFHYVISQVSRDPRTKFYDIAWILLEAIERGQASPETIREIMQAKDESGLRVFDHTRVAGINRDFHFGVHLRFVFEPLWKEVGQFFATADSKSDAHEKAFREQLHKVMGELEAQSPPEAQRGSALRGLLEIIRVGREEYSLFEQMLKQDNGLVTVKELYKKLLESYPSAHKFDIAQGFLMCAKDLPKGTPHKDELIAFFTGERSNFRAEEEAAHVT